MTKKYKDLLGVISLGTVGTGVEIAWTGFLINAASKIPYIGIPVAIFIGAVGAGCTIFIANGSYTAFCEWRQEYLNK